MANGPTLPPQAYTREILTAAFNWLQIQPESVKKLAVTPDALVGLYMRAQRYGASSMEVDAPVSSQAFMSDLKNLAEGLKQFDDPRRAPQTSQSHSAAGFSHASSSHSQIFTQQTQQASQTIHQGIGATAYPSSTSSLQHRPESRSEIRPEPKLDSRLDGRGELKAETKPEVRTEDRSETPPGTGSDSLIYLGLHERAEQMIHEVKNSLNLTCNSEAINMMVTIAYKQIKNLLP